VHEIVIAGIEKLVTHHAIYRPKDLMSAQYSIPFCVALSLFHDPKDPASFSERRVRDKKILSMMRRVRLRVDREIEEKGWDRAARVTVGLKNRRRHSALVIHFRGTPANPMSPAELEEKARTLTRGILSQKKLGRLFETVRNIDKIKDISRLGSLLRSRR
jgi:2-methylcitrate dehydratase PrpD